MNTSGFSLRRCAPMLLGLLPLSVAMAQEAGNPRSTETFFELRTGVVRSDNVLRSAVGGESGTLYVAGLGIDMDRDGRRLDVRARGSLDWLKYSNNASGNELTGSFDGTAAFDVIPELFRWNFEETYGQLRVDPFSAGTPGNLEGVNYFTTGPQLNFRLGTNTRMQLRGDYSNARHGDLNIDSNRVGGGATLARDLSNTDLLSLNVTTEHNSFTNNELDADYDERQAFVAFDGSNRRGSLRMALGYSMLELQNNEQSKGLLAHLEAQRRVSAASVIGLFVSQQYSNSTDLFRGALDRRDFTVPPPALAIPEAFQDKAAGVDWTFERGRTSMSFSASRREETYKVNISSNRSIDSFDLQLVRRMTPKLTAKLAGYLQQEDFDNVNFDAREKGVTAALEWLIGRHLGFTARYNWVDRSSSNPLAGYLERRIGLTLFYRPD